MDINSIENIKLIGILLILLSMIIFYMMYKSGKNQKKGTSMYLSEDLLNGKSQIAADINEKTLKEIKKENQGTSMYLDKKKNLMFSMSPITIMFNNAKKIYNPNFQIKKDIVFSFKDFYMNLNLKFNSYIQNGILPFNSEDLEKITKSISKGDLGEIKKTLENILKNKGMFENDRAYKILSKAIVETINMEEYKLYREIEKEMSELSEKIKSVDIKNESGVQLQPEDKEILERKEQGVTLASEIGKISKNLIVLKIDKEARSLHLYLDFKNLFDEDVNKVINYYKNLGILNNVIFYI